MTESFDSTYRQRFREENIKRKSIEEANAEDARERGIGPSHFGYASSSVGEHRSEVWVNGKQLQGVDVPQGRPLGKQEPIKFEPYMTPADQPPTNNAPSHHTPSVFNNRRHANHMGWEYSHNRPPIEPTPEPKITKASNRKRK